jgi:DNA-binding NarL/FixJ family response regulator
MVGLHLAQTCDAMWTSAYVAAAAVVVWLLFRPWQKRQPPASTTQQRLAERDLAELMQQMTQLATKATAQMEERAGALAELIRQADARIAQLKGPATAGPLSTTPPTASIPTVPPLTAPPPHVEVADERHVAVYELADQGASALDIAQQLGRPRGEIELILALRPRTR